jgi:hypothetical protein
MRTRLRVCQAKRRFADATGAQAVAQSHGFVVRAYRCDRCEGWHLTSRRKGKRIPRPG